MNRKVEKLTEVLRFADSAGPKVIIYFYQWFDELASSTGELHRQEINLLMSAASRVLKKLFLDKVSDLSAFDSNRQVPLEQWMTENNKSQLSGKNADDIKKLLIAELIEVAQRANAERILQASYEIGRNGQSDPLAISSASKS